MTPRYAAALASATLAVLAGGLAGCHRDGCLGGDDGTCMPPSACPALKYEKTCAAAPTVARFMLDGPVNTSDPRDPKARGTTGDIVLANDLIRVVLAGPSHACDLAPTGGSIIDLSLVAAPGDQINSIHQAAGLLPRDAVHYESKKFDEGDDYVAVVFRGHLEADSRVTVVTRYEVRACEPGVRVRSDLYNGGSDANTLFLADGLFWGDHGPAPFVPGVGLGFRAPEVNLRDIASAWTEWPFVAARAEGPPDLSYAVVPCDPPQAAGFNDPTLTASGLPLTTTLPGDGIRLERFILAKQGPGLADAIREALQIRAKVHGESVPVAVTGRVVAGGAPIQPGSGRAASLLFYEPAFGPDPDDPARRTPWSEAVPNGDGTFSVALPPDRSYRVQPYAFGLPAAAPTAFAVARDPVNIGDVTLTASAHLVASVSTAPGLAPDPMTYAELVLIPVDPPPTDRPKPSLYGLFPGCDPMLGPPHGASPACNRAISRDGTFNLLIPPGAYFVYATRGPFAKIDRAEITVAAGREARLPPLIVQPLSILPAGALSGDFHVHGAASFDSAIPDRDRVISFLASGVDVIVATDHDVVTSYQNVLHGLGMGADPRLALISGVEQTPNIPWLAVPGNDLPTTVGHFNFWPLVPDVTLPGNGAPWDEVREPGQMMDDMDALFPRLGVRQLNHPFAESKLGRDQGFMQAIGYDPRTPITPGASFAADVLLSVPGGPGHHSNIDWDVQEVMTGASVENWLRYRALWFSMLSQGIVRAGAANSDTHSLGLEQVGYPRNIVFGNHQRDGLDVERFDDDVRRGHMQGTNGPVLDVTIEDRGATYRPGLDPIHVSPDARLTFSVSAAPWIPVTEARIIVNGVLAKAPIALNEFVGADRFSAQPVKTTTHTFPLSSLLPMTHPPSPQVAKTIDAWLIVEAGLELPAAPDVDGDGLPDLANPNIAGRPDKDDPRFDYQAIAPGSWPVAFTNPFLIDVDGGGWQAPGLP